MLNTQFEDKGDEAEDNEMGEVFSNEQERMKKFYESLTEKQQNRYETFKAAVLSDKKIKKVQGLLTLKVVQHILSSNAIMEQSVYKALAGISKVFIGELIEEGVFVEFTYY